MSHSAATPATPANPSDRHDGDGDDAAVQLNHSYFDKGNGLQTVFPPPAATRRRLFDTAEEESPMPQSSRSTDRDGGNPSMTLTSPLHTPPGYHARRRSSASANSSPTSSASPSTPVGGRGGATAADDSSPPCGSCGGNLADLNTATGQLLKRWRDKERLYRTQLAQQDHTIADLQQRLSQLQKSAGHDRKASEQRDTANHDLQLTIEQLSESNITLQRDLTQVRDMYAAQKRKLDQQRELESQLHAALEEKESLLRQHAQTIADLKAALSQATLRNNQLAESAEQAAQYADTVQVLEGTLEQVNAEKLSLASELEQVTAELIELRNIAEFADTGHAQTLDGEMARIKKAIGPFAYEGSAAEYPAALENALSQTQDKLVHSERQLANLSKNMLKSPQQLFESTVAGNENDNNISAPVTPSNQWRLRSGVISSPCLSPGPPLLEDNAQASDMVDDEYVMCLTSTPSRPGLGTAENIVWNLFGKLGEDVSQLVIDTENQENQNSRDLPAWLSKLKQQVEQVLQESVQELSRLRAQRKQLKQKLAECTRERGVAVKQNHIFRAERAENIRNLADTVAARDRVEKDYRDVCAQLKAKHLEVKELRAELDRANCKLADLTERHERSVMLHMESRHSEPLSPKPPSTPLAAQLSPCSASRAAAIVEKRNQELAEYRATIVRLEEELQRRTISNDPLRSPDENDTDNSFHVVDESLPNEPSRILRMLATSLSPKSNQLRNRKLAAREPESTSTTVPAVPASVTSSDWIAWRNAFSLWGYTILTWLFGVLVGMWAVGWLVRSGMVRLPHPLAARPHPDLLAGGFAFSNDLYSDPPDAASMYFDADSVLFSADAYSVNTDSLAEDKHFEEDETYDSKSLYTRFRRVMTQLIDWLRELYSSLFQFEITDTPTETDKSEPVMYDSKNETEADQSEASVEQIHAADGAVTAIFRGE